MGKRLFDIMGALFGLLLTGWIVVLCYVLASVDTRSNGLFMQARIGRFGKPFTIYKLKTMQPQSGEISKFGSFLRQFKIDELPQLVNVLLGDMSLVGPRPDIAGYYDLLQGTDRKLLELRPGITSPASIKYRDEEAILAQQPDPLFYNDSVIFPDKVKMSLDYYHDHSVAKDITIIWRTIFPKL